MSSNKVSKPRNALYYAIGSIFNAASGLISIPILTHALSSEEFGTYDILLRISNFMLIAIFLGCRQSFFRYFYYKPGVEWQKSLIATMSLLMIFNSAVVLTIMFFLDDLIITQVFQGRTIHTLYFLMLAWVPVDIFFNFGTAYLIISERARTYVLINITKTILYISLIYLALYEIEFGLRGVFYSLIAASGIFSISFLTFFISWSRLQFSMEILKELLVFGIPILPAAFFSYVLMSADRYFLITFTDLAQVGIYALAAKISFMAMAFLDEPFSKIWSPLIFKNCDSKEGPAIIGHALDLYIIINLVAILAVSILAPLYIPIIASSDYLEVINVIPICTLAASLYFIACLADAGTLIAKKTHFKTLSFGIASVACLASNAILVPLCGMYGSALASSIGFLFLLAFTLHYSNKFYYIPLSWPVLIKAFFAVCICFVAGRLFLSFSNSLLQTGLTGGITVIIYLLLLSKIYNPPDEYSQYINSLILKYIPILRKHTD